MAASVYKILATDSGSPRKSWNKLMIKIKFKIKFKIKNKITDWSISLFPFQWLQGFVYKGERERGERDRVLLKYW